MIYVKSFLTKSWQVVHMWNNMPNDDVHAESTNVFKTRLDKLCDIKK